MTDKVKLRITAVIVREVEVERDWYIEEDQTPERMLAVELDNANEDFDYFLENECVSTTITGEVISG